MQAARGLLIVTTSLLWQISAAGVRGAPAAVSKLWGKRGERWDPAGPLPDFSFAGYKQGNVRGLPRPPVTRNVAEFRRPGMSDTQMLKAALAWAHKQPVTKDWIVLALPKGTLTLEETVYIRRSKLVLRGAGTGATVLYVPKSLTGVYGKNKGETGGYVNTGGFITIQGKFEPGLSLSRVTADARKGSKTVLVDRPNALRVGEYYTMLYTDVKGRFNNLMFNNLWVAPERYKGSTRTRFMTKIVGKAGNRITLERHLPYPIRGGINTVNFHRISGTVEDSGVEDLSFRFRWELYAGHHLEKGWNAVWMDSATDCWIRDIATVNADNVVLIYRSTSVTVSGVRIEASRTRANNIPNRWNERADQDGHWGVQFGHSTDVLVEKFDVRCKMMHDVGTDTSSKFCVFMDGKMTDGNLDLHRGLAGPTLYTNIDVGTGSTALYSGGPARSGPNAVAGTTWWHIRSRQAVDPPKSNEKAGACSFGPAINLVGVNIKSSQVRRMCRTWFYERTVNAPANLYRAQFERRMAAARAANAPAGGLLG